MEVRKIKSINLTDEEKAEIMRQHLHQKSKLCMVLRVVAKR
jgi:hypothetical protein